MSTSRRSSAGKSKKTPYHHGELRPALIAAAVEMLAAAGAHELSLRAVARRAGVSHAASYRHFSSKESVLAAVAEEGFELLADGMERAAGVQPRGAAARLQAAGIAYVDFGVRHPHHLQVMFGGAIGRFADHPTLAAAAGRARRVLATVVGEGLASGELAAADGSLVEISAWALVHGLASLMASGQIRTPQGRELSPADQAGLGRAITAFFCAALAPRG